MKAETQVIAMRFAHKVCVKRIVRKLRKYGKAIVMTTVVLPESSERAAVDEIIREENNRA